MTRPKTSRYPVSSFGPELMETLLQGAVKEVRIPCPDQKTMQYLQMRIQMLRGAMAREGHPKYELSTRARTARDWNREKGPDVDCVLIVRPHDSQFSDILSRAGITSSQAARDILDESAIPETPNDPTIQPRIEPANDEAFTISPYDRFK